MSRKLVIANQKGGVGKSTLVMNLAAALAEQGQRVLMIDLDPQGALTASLGLDIYDVERSVYSLLMFEQASMTRALVTFSEQLALLPAGAALSAAEAKLGTTKDGPYRLRNSLGRTRIPFDVMLIDTPANLGILTANGLAAANELLIPVGCQFLAMRGVRALIEILPYVRQRVNPDLHLLGLVGTMYRPNSLHSQEVIAEIRSVFPDETFATLIHDDDLLAEAPVAAQSVLDYAPDSAPAAAFRALAQEVLDARR